MRNIDRVLMSIEWKTRFPLCTLRTLTRIGSDHCPLLLSDGTAKALEPRQFFFEKQWTAQKGFSELIQQKWGEASERHPVGAYSVDKWHGNMSRLRKFLKGWGANLRGEYRRAKTDLLARIQEIDEKLV